MKYYNPELATYLESLWNRFDSLQSDNIRLDEVADFGKCIELMENTPEISGRLDKLITTEFSNIGGLIENARTALIKFLYSKHYSLSKSFEENYIKFEQTFYEDTVNVIYRIRLMNFEMSNEIFELFPFLRIAERPILMREHNIIVPHYVIEIEQGYKTSVNSPYADEHISIPFEEREKEYNYSETFERIIKILRLLRSGGVSIDNRVEIYSTFSWFAGHSRIMHYRLARSFMPSLFLDSDLAKMKMIFDMYNDLGDRFDIAISRLSMGLENPKLEYSILDYMIAIEALFLPGIHQELRFRVGLRVALKLCQHLEDRKNMSTLIKKLYDFRSKLAHGENLKTNEEFYQKLEQLEKILRDSLLLFIEDPTNFSQSAFTNLELGY